VPAVGEERGEAVAGLVTERGGREADGVEAAGERRVANERLGVRRVQPRPR